MKNYFIFALTIAALLVTLPAALRAADVAGKWQFALQTDNGPREVPVELKIDGESVSGTFDTATVTGTWKDGALNLAFPYHSAEGGFTANVTLKGKLDGDAITGNWTFGEYGGPFKATRRS